MDSWRVYYNENFFTKIILSSSPKTNAKYNNIDSFLLQM